MSFRDAACEYLSKYKVDQLGVEEKGIFPFRGKNISMAHILPVRHHQLNILEEYRSRFFSSDYGRIKLHRFFHHLNSSQAMCINLFYPLVAEGKLDPVTKFLGIPSAVDLTPCFEKESEVEDAVRRTSFDFYIRYSETQELFFEVKYTEEGFGKARSDEEHKRKFKDTYRSLVEGSAYLTDICRDEQFFLNHYQVLRNLVHISETRQVVFLFPAANSGVAKEADDAYEKFLTDAGRTKVKIVRLENLIAFIESECPSDSLATYYSKFREKYLPSVSLGPNK
jgi:hypothetical protein